MSFRLVESRAIESWVGQKFELGQIQANSSQVCGQTTPNSIPVENVARIGLRGEYRLARALGAKLRRLVVKTWMYDF